MGNGDGSYIEYLKLRGVSFYDNRAWAAGQKFVMHLPRSAEHVIPLLSAIERVQDVSGVQLHKVEVIG